MLKESRVHGEHLQPFGAYSLEYGPGEHVLDCHWHDESEFFYVLEGSVMFQVDEELFPVHAGEAVFIDGGDIHAGHAYGDEGCRFFCAGLRHPAAEQRQLRCDPEFDRFAVPGAQNLIPPADQPQYGGRIPPAGSSGRHPAALRAAEPRI
ncbi:cupin domain-containing protein [Paenibacillus yonginensis]|uniref:cupin domain-containing protein n=1 Tax=Paenibacillus yonginensis TaxID=1462996 RepID=UPI0030015000